MDATAANSGPNVEVLGTVKRVVKRAATPADRLSIDDSMHTLIEAKVSNERQERRAQKALAKLRKRSGAIEAQIRDVHSKRTAAHVEDVVACRVERTPTELRIVHPDGTPVYARALTKDELAVLSSRLPDMKEAATIRHPELDQSDEVAEVEKRVVEAKTQHAELTQALTFEQAVAEADAEEDAANDNSEPKEKPKKGKGKGKKAKGEQLEMGGTDAVN